MPSFITQYCMKHGWINRRNNRTEKMPYIRVTIGDMVSRLHMQVICDKKTDELIYEILGPPTRGLINNDDWCKSVIDHEINEAVWKCKK